MERFLEPSACTHRELRFEGDKHISKGPPESIYAPPLAVYVNSPSRLESRRDETLRMSRFLGVSFAAVTDQIHTENGKKSQRETSSTPKHIQERLRLARRERGMDPS